MPSVPGTPDLVTPGLGGGGQGPGLLLVAGAYLLGSISFAWWLVRLRKGVDLRTVGSGNLGATNAGRVLGRRWALFIYLLDLLKGLVPVLIARQVTNPERIGPAFLDLAMGGAAILGHCFPVWHRFKGGKGVATASGVILGLTPIAFVVGLAVFGLAILLFRMVSLGSVLAAVALPLSWLLIGGERAREGRGFAVLLFYCALGAMVIALHRKNLQRILAGTEPRMGARRT